MDKAYKFSLLVGAVAEAPGWNKTKVSKALGIGRTYLSSILSKNKSTTDEMYLKMERLAKEVLPLEIMKALSDLPFK